MAQSSRNATRLPSYTEDTAYELAQTLEVVFSGDDDGTQLDLELSSNTTLSLSATAPPEVIITQPSTEHWRLVGPRAHLNVASRLLVLHPPADASHTLWVNVTVSDDHNTPAVFPLAISGVPVNDAPRPLTPETNVTACVGTTLTYDVEADALFTDPEGDAFEIADVTTELSEDLYNPVTHRIVWNDIPTGFEGTYVFNVTVRDTHGAMGYHLIKVWVRPSAHLDCQALAPSAEKESATVTFIKDNAPSIFGALGGAVSLALTILLVCWVSARNRRKSLQFLEDFYEQRGHPPKAHELLVNLSARIKKRSGVDGGEALLLKLRRKNKVTWEGSSKILPADDAFVELVSRQAQRMAVDDAVRATTRKTTQSFPDGQGNTQVWVRARLEGSDDADEEELVPQIAQLPAVQALSLTDEDLETAVTTLAVMGLWAWSSDTTPDAPPGLWLCKTASAPAQGRNSPAVSRPRLSQVVPIYSDSASCSSRDEESGLLSDPPPPPYASDQHTKSGSDISSLLLDE